MVKFGRLVSRAPYDPSDTNRKSKSKKTFFTFFTILLQGRFI